MYIYATSKNSGPSYYADHLHLLYLGTSVEEAENAVGDFSRYQKQEMPAEDRRKIYSALPKEVEREMIQFYVADGWWYSIEMFELHS